MEKNRKISNTSGPARNSHTLGVYQGANGFTLLEILATFVLIAIIIPVAMQGISLSIKMASWSKQHNQACSLAQTKLTELLITEDYLRGDLSGDFSSDEFGYHWRTELAEWTGPTLKQLVLHVEWEDRQIENRVSLSTLVYVRE